MAPAGLAWLDYSDADQRRAREIVAMFSQRESRDELGIGRIRDALSDTLFPGTSFLLTRARYLLFVPWLYREGARLGHGGPRLAQWAERRERCVLSPKPWPSPWASVPHRIPACNRLRPMLSRAARTAWSDHRRSRLR